ncbi:flagellar hook-length control protein FliK [Lederbergia sp. NSJ-179]|uniref:flagellar hook-length control protein FliK n=1 Tax=Lederbergia sp. NSJ-179 TaxID=2931402 RepID=UPI001FD52ADA|nr:flagellar hook-length control protein FliK [Lederbergia sp. NSJ-179]MCJ7839643.1 flagellar hook-length control protein FliK [Lederbergia sp. NSJ-179]
MNKLDLGLLTLGATNLPSGPALEQTAEFQLIMENLLGEAHALFEEIPTPQTEEIKLPIEKILEWMTVEDSELKLVNEDDKNLDLPSIMTEQYPDWQTVISQINDWLEEKTDFRPVEDQQNHVLMAHIQLLQALNNLEPSAWSDIPEEPLATFIKIGKELQSLSKQMGLSGKEMGQLVEMARLSHSLFERLQQVAKLQTIEESIPKAFSHMNDQEKSLILHRQTFHHLSNQIATDQRMQTEKTALIQESIPKETIGNQSNLSRLELLQLNVEKPIDQQPAFRSFIRELANQMGRSNFTQTPHAAKLTIRLYPAELGSLRVELLQKDGVMTARFLASTATAKELLDVQLHSLKSAFSQQNIAVDRIEVSISDPSQLKYTNQHGRSGQDQHDQQAYQEEKKQSDHESNFQETINQVLFETEV